jgi:glycerophosphoryl diester phosphodiesterase
MQFCGHRGYKACEVENSAKAFERAIGEGIDWIEFDVVKTRDGVPVIFHDARVDRLLNGHGPVASFTLAELQTMQYADGQTVITLDEGLELMSGRVKPMVELKADGLEAQTLTLLDKWGFVPEQTIIQSFKGRHIAACHAIDDRWMYGLCMSYLGSHKLLGRWDNMQARAARRKFARAVATYPATWLNLDGPFIYDAFMEECHRHGKRIILGAMNPEAQFPNLEKWHVEIINANDPAQTRTLYRNFCETSRNGQ